jgi:hypothetical protein
MTLSQTNKTSMKHYRNFATLNYVTASTSAIFVEFKQHNVQRHIARQRSSEADRIKRSHHSTPEITMNPAATPKDPRTVRPLLDEADIGSGEKTPAQQETEEMIRQIPPLPASEHPATGDKSKPAPPNRP